MSYEEKGTWVYLVVSVATYLGYVAVIVSRADGTPLPEVSYVAAMLWAIGIGIAATIVGRILIEIAKPSDNYTVDVRDKEINRKGEYAGGIALAVGMLVPFGLAMADVASFWIANAMFTVFNLMAVVGALVKLIAYRRGL